MISPAKRHVMRVQAAQEAARAAESNVRPDAPQYELMMAQLYEDRRRLKAIESIKAKGLLKAELLDSYAPYIAGVLESDAGAQDDVLMTVMLWSIDAGYYGGALEIAEYALRHGLAMPDKYQRSTACVIAEEIADAANKGTDQRVPVATLLKAVELTAEQDMPDQVRAKLHKALGMALADSEPECALLQLRAALTYDERSGVKTLIGKLERELEKNSAASGPA
ncbi:phage terminase small subunit [Marinobacterium sedimentorum]|uniref:phage terminase small subunit n=1 Tax=Marinobacterium sedimentorum TaxID=2927804 RepID=UPI0020C728E7|nr:phage terminase small subunit [Marinobacterium sedimentorum]MCP8687765.1 phage terminase small subunit [Marinobacterium sedimentorum]